MASPQCGDKGLSGQTRPLRPAPTFAEDILWKLNLMMLSKCGDKEVSGQMRRLRSASTITGEIGRKLASLEAFLPGPHSTSASTPKTGQHAISPVAPQQTPQPPSGPSSQLHQSLSASNSPPSPSSLIAKDERQSSSAATSEPPPYSPPPYSPIAKDEDEPHSSIAATNKHLSYPSTAEAEPQSSSAAISDAPKSPPDLTNQSSQSSPTLETQAVPRLIDKSRYYHAFRWRISRMMASNAEVDSLRGSVCAPTNDQVKESLELFKVALPGFVGELLTLLDGWENSYYEMLMHWMDDEEKERLVLAYLKWIPGLDEETNETLFTSAISDKSFGHGLYFDYLLTCTDVIPIGDQTFDLLEQIAASESVARFHEGRLAKGHTSARLASNALFYSLIQHDHDFQEREFHGWRTAHKKTVKYGKRALQAREKALTSVRDCSKMTNWKEDKEAFVRGVGGTLNSMGRINTYEQMINHDLNNMGFLLGVLVIEPFLQVPLVEREKVFNGCNRFRLHKPEDPEPSEE